MRAVHLYQFCLMMLLFTTAVAAQGADRWGDLTGRVLFDGPIPEARPLVVKGDADVRDAACCAKIAIPDESLVIDGCSRGVANCFVYLRERPQAIHPDLVEPAAKEVAWGLRDCRLQPHVIAVRTGRELRVTGRDDVVHNVHLYPLRQKQFGALTPPRDGGTLLPAFERPEPVPVKATCDIHPWIVGYVHVADHPYVAITDAEGRFSIPDLSVGEHEFRVWHERVGYVEKSLKVEVRAGTTECPAVRLSADRLLK